ncbi:MAG: sigma-70 family RNA polymerase sigma factor [Planctomyces sp.]|nr:sigma-70 family RNA polymerase sigma factor [Planctomyces sp.]
MTPADSTNDETIQLPESNSGDDLCRTRVSLLLRLRNAADHEAWTEFYEVYSPLIYHYARSRGLQHSDAEDTRAECLESVARQITGFDYDRSRGGFRAWLRTLAIRRIIDKLRKRQLISADSAELNSLPDVHEPVDELWDREWRHQHLKHSMENARRQVNEQTWQIFELLINNELSVQEVCEQLGVTANHVYKARGRVLELVRERMRYLQADEPP